MQCTLPVRRRHIALLLLLLSSIGCANSTAPSSTTTPSTFTITWNSGTFPATAVGTTSSTSVVATLWNYGSASVPVGSVTDSNAGEFPWSTTCPLNGALAAASTCAITTQFKPAALGVQNATIVINANGKDQSLSLGGTGIQPVNPQLSIDPASGSAATPFVLTLTGVTPGGQVTLNTTYTPAPGNSDIPFSPTVWTADASGRLAVTSTHDSPGTFENWFVEAATSVASNHVVSVVQ